MSEGQDVRGSKLQSLSPVISILVRILCVIQPQIHISRNLMMDSMVKSLNSAYQDFIAAAAGVLEAKDNSNGLRTATTDAALENFKQWELFRVACDQVEEFVESVKQRIGSECLVDEATGSGPLKSGQITTTSLPPISAVRLEQMSKAVRWLVIELPQGSGTDASTASHSHSSVPFDARFSEDAAH